MRHTFTNTALPALVLFALVQVTTESLAQQSALDQSLIQECWNGNSEKVADLLKRGANPNAQGVGGYTALHRAADRGDLIAMRLVIDHGANVNARTNDGHSTPLLEAAASREPAAITMLLEAGAKPDGSELGQACWLGRTEVVKLLLATGVNPDAGIGQAAQGGHVAVVALLLDKGANVNAKSANGHTALHLGALQGGPKVVELLLKAGANPNTINNKGQSPLHLVHSSQVNPNEYLQIVQLLIAHRANVNAKSEDGTTPLHKAASDREATSVRLLLEAGADPNATNKGDQTPLHLTGEFECIKLLVQAGAKLDAPDKDGVTPVRMAGIRRDKPVYDWLLAANGGKEPPLTRRLVPDPKFAAKSTTELIALLAPEQPELYFDLQREFIARGPDALPHVLKSIESGKGIENFISYFAVMGPNVEAALPTLVSQLANKDQVYTAITVIDEIKPGTFAALPDVTKRQAADALYQTIAASEPDQLAGSYISVLGSTGKLAAPAFLQLLRHPTFQIRHFAAEQLQQAQFSDQQVEAELWKLSWSDPDLRVREAAIEAFGRFAQPDEVARSGLLTCIKSAPPFHPPATNQHWVPQELQWHNVANQAAFALASRFGAKAIDDLIPLLSPMDSPQRIPAIRGLEYIGAPAIPRLTELLTHHDRSVVISAKVALEGIKVRLPISKK